MSTSPPPLPPDHGYAASFPAQAGAVRTELARLMTCPLVQTLGSEDRGTAELLLAEALNNIVEHAYARWPGDIAVDLRREGDRILVRIEDRGLPMPEARLPQGHLPQIDAQDDLPEGGFGWFLIRNLAEDLTYHRDGAINRLGFCLSVNNWEDEG